ncbi:MAG: hypothetical protein LC803_22140 [Acidobacteria bacterium]|nr:hypothetical protein [Acidobacteriota bacterium]
MLKGTATGVRESIHVRGDSSSVSTSHRTIFKIGTTTVIFVSNGMPIIGEGDRLTVAGTMKGRVLLAEAYRNDTAGVRGNSGMRETFFGMVITFVAGAVGLGWALLEPLIPELPRLPEGLWWLVFPAGAFFTVLGFYYLYKWLRIRSAVGLVRSS